MTTKLLSALLCSGLATASLTAGCGDSASPAPAQTFDACTTPVSLTAPNPAYIWTPNSIRLVSQRLAEGVFAVYDSNAPSHSAAGIPSATSGGFVIGDNGVLLVESMINRQLFCQMVALVKKETDKPVTHVINTSSHGDHSYGNAFLPAGVHIVQHQRTADDPGQQPGIPQPAGLAHLRQAQPRGRHLGHIGEDGHPGVALLVGG